MLDNAEFLLTEAFMALRRNGLMVFAAITTVAVSLFLLGGLGYAYFQMSLYAESLPDQFTMEVFLKEGATEDEVRETGKTIRAMPAVKAAILVSKADAWKVLEKELALPGIGSEIVNPLTDKYQIVLKDLNAGEAVSAQIGQMDAVMANGVKYLAAEQRFFEQMLRLIRLLGSVVGGLLFATSGILIYNAIRLTLVSRRLEIRVMQLVGASRFTIRVPFLLEGMTQGAFGGALAGLLLWASHSLLQQAIRGFQAFGPLPPYPGWPIVGALAAVGAAYGLFSSALALGAPLRYR